MPFRLARRVLIASVYFLGQSNESAKGYVLSGLFDSPQPIDESTCYFGIDWLAIVGVVLTVISRKIAPCFDAGGAREWHNNEHCVCFEFPRGQQIPRSNH